MDLAKNNISASNFARNKVIDRKKFRRVELAIAPLTQQDHNLNHLKSLTDRRSTPIFAEGYSSELQMLRNPFEK